jgi:hypothetical protein
MKTHRLVYCFFIFLISLLCSGCTINWQWGEGSSFGDDGAAGDDNTSVLPDPPGGEAHPPLDEAQQTRQDEVDHFIAEVLYFGATITQTIQLPSGDIVDGLDRNTLPALPYALPPLPFTPDALQHGGVGVIGEAVLGSTRAWNKGRSA